MKHRSPLRVCLIVAGVLLAACRAIPLPESTSEVSTASTTPDWDIFRLGPGDRVHLSVFGQPDFSSPDEGVRIATDGSLSVPLLGSVGVEGRTADEVRQTIEAGLEKYLQEPSVTLWVVEYSSRRFHILGEVVAPGPYAMDRPMTALEAIAMGQGIKAGGNREKVVILRKHGAEDIEVIPFDVRIPGADGLVQVRPDDVLFVSKSGVGRFSEQVLPYLQGIGYSLSQATSLALVLERF